MPVPHDCTLVSAGLQLKQWPRITSAPNGRKIIKPRHEETHDAFGGIGGLSGYMKCLHSWNTLLRPELRGIRWPRPQYNRFQRQQMLNTVGDDSMVNEEGHRVGFLILISCSQPLLDCAGPCKASLHSRGSTARIFSAQRNLTRTSSASAARHSILV
jgi:hypothetical protein